MTARFALGLAAAAAAATAGAAVCAKAGLPDYASPQTVVLAVKADFAPPGGMVRLTVYDSAAHFLHSPLIKHQGTVDANGYAVIALPSLRAGSYAFAAYYDVNGDGMLNRSMLGRPKEPFVFSNDVRPKLRKPKFNETAVTVAPGDVVVLTLKN